MPPLVEPSAPGTPFVGKLCKAQDPGLWDPHVPERGFLSQEPPSAAGGRRDEGVRGVSPSSLSPAPRHSHCLKPNTNSLRLCWRTCPHPYRGGLGLSHQVTRGLGEENSAMKAKPGAMVPEEQRLAHPGSRARQGEATGPHLTATTTAAASLGEAAVSRARALGTVLSALRRY